MEWINQRFNEWRGDRLGHDGSMTRYAEDYIGIDKRIMEGWLKGRAVPRDSGTISKLVKVYGLDVLLVLGYIPPDVEEEFTRQWLDEHRADLLDE